MAAWPPYIKLLLSGTSETFEPAVERNEMERGVPKQRILNSQVLAELTSTALFQSNADIARFDDWYFDIIQRVGWFDLRHPRTGKTVQARFVGGKLGALTPQSGGFALATREITVEYLR
jgi:hypothetical protein